MLVLKAIDYQDLMGSSIFNPHISILTFIMFDDYSTSQRQSAVLSISELNHQAKHLLEISLSEVWIEGELASLSKPWSGHWYFNLKDDKAQVRCVMFRNANSQLKWSPQIGDKVLAKAKVSLFEARGEFQLIIGTLKPSGAGELQLAFEKLKTQLEAEGLFSPELKKPIPETPNSIGVITSATGAAVHDIISVIRRRCPLQKIYIIPTQVQGDTAAKSIAKAISTATDSGLFDVLIVGRGGGSMEDLWAFNEEITARAIANCPIPIISAVGHETDFTIADFVADYRAPTPTAAAEKVSPDQQEWIFRLDQLQARLSINISRKLELEHRHFEKISARLKHPKVSLIEIGHRLNEASRRLQLEIQDHLKQLQNRLEFLKTRLITNTPTRAIENRQQQTNQLKKELQQRMLDKLYRYELALSSTAQQLHSVSPLATLDRGFSIITNQKNKVINQISQSKKGDQITARLTDGYLECTVTDIQPIKTD
jgi:exodeoxyribonuclease VII large subunit